MIRKVFEKPVVNDADDCPICLEPLVNSGDHRISATKCGHLFGYSCITKALSFSKECPTCRSKLNKRRDIIPLYNTGTKVLDIDAISLMKFKKELEDEKSKRLKVEECLERNMDQNKQLRTSLQHTQHELCESNRRTALLERELQQLRARGVISSEEVSGTRSAPWTFSSLPLKGAKHLRVHESSPQVFYTHEDSEGGHLVSKADLERFSAHGSHSVLGAAKYLSPPFDISVGNELTAVTCSDIAGVQFFSGLSKEPALCILDKQSRCCTFTSDNIGVWVGKTAGKLALFDLRRTCTAVFELPVASGGPPVQSICSLVTSDKRRQEVTLGASGGGLWSVVDGEVSQRSLPPTGAVYSVLRVSGGRRDLALVGCRGSQQAAPALLTVSLETDDWSETQPVTVLRVHASVSGHTMGLFASRPGACTSESGFSICSPDDDSGSIAYWSSPYAAENPTTTPPIFRVGRGSYGTRVLQTAAWNAVGKPSLVLGLSADRLCLHSL